MITLQNYDAYSKGKTLGSIRKAMSDMIEDFSWNNHVESRIGYLYDWYHDAEQTTLDDLKPWNNPRKIPMDIKFIVSSNQTMAKDAITYQLQMRPHQTVCVDYYNEFFAKRYGAVFPCGLYVDIEDSKHKWNRWLVVALADYNDPQFPTFEILRCDYVLNVILDGIKYNIPIALRSQNSYNSGIWRDYRTETIEDQQKFMIPLNRITEKIWYNKRFLIDNMVITDECRAWRVSKVNRINFKGLIMTTLVQDHFNKDTDYMEKDADGNTVALWADYYSEPVTPEDYKPTPDEHSTTYGVITCAGKNDIKVGGSFKKLTINFFDKDDQPSAFEAGTWSFSIDGEIITPTISTTGLDENQIKIKLSYDESIYINKILAITYTVTESGLRTVYEMNVVSL